MLRIENGDGGTIDPDLIRLAADLPVRSHVKAAWIVPRRAGRLRRLLGISTARLGRAVTLRLTSCDRRTGGEHDTPAALIDEQTALHARTRVGSLVVLEDDIEIAQRTGQTAPAGRIVRTRAHGDEIVLICHWWTRTAGALGRIDDIARIDRSNLLPHIYARRVT